MATTTIHIPNELLLEVDARARAEGVSRNRFILRAVERALSDASAWSPGFIDELRRPLARADARAVNEMLVAIESNRSSKPAPPL